MGTTPKVQVNVDSLAAMGKRFSQAWGRAVKGEQGEETHITFLDVQTMLETLSPRRLDMLRHVRQHGASNVRELAQTLGRDYKNVHQDQYFHENQHPHRDRNQDVNSNQNQYPHQNSNQNQYPYQNSNQNYNSNQNHHRRPR